MGNRLFHMGVGVWKFDKALSGSSYIVATVKSQREKIYKRTHKTMNMRFVLQSYWRLLPDPT